MDDEDGGIFNIALSDSEQEEPEEPKDRNVQSEAAFQAVKQSYAAKIENGNVRAQPHTSSSCTILTQKIDSWTCRFPARQGHQETSDPGGPSCRGGAVLFSAFPGGS